MALRAANWAGDLPILPVPPWIAETRSVSSSASLPVEVRESLSNLTATVSAIAPSATTTLTLYEIPDLALLGSATDADDPSRLLLASPFQSLPFVDRVTHHSYARARWLSHQTGTFLTPDPMGYQDSPNLYAFAGGDPVSKRDPRGEALYAFDGTWNDKDDATQPQTNVAKLWAVYKEAAEYEVGVGTRWYSSWLGGAAGAGATARVKDAFERLKENYRAGDTNIDIIGFSRGSAEAIEFANLINNEGVSDGKGQTVIPSIRFVGVFDMVGSIGIAGTNLNPGFLLTLPPNVVRARMAIATSEFRGSFPLSHLSNPSCPDRRVIEKACRGAHSDVGGGYDTGSVLSNEALNWMWREMKAAELPISQLSPSQRTVSNSGPAHRPQENWKYLSTRARLWYDELADRPAQRKEYFPMCVSKTLR